MRRIVSTTSLACLLLSIGIVLSVFGQDVPQGRLVRDDGVSVTIYNRGSALIQDRRTFDLVSGLNTVDFSDVAARIDSTSVSFRSLSDPFGTRVLEQNYVFDLVNSTGLLNRYLDETIAVTTQEGSTFIGQLVGSRNREIILRLEDGKVMVLSISTIRDLRFPELPDALTTRPTLRWLLQSAQTGEQQVELTYLTNGMTWEADYNILLATDNQSLDLTGWVTLNNTSGTAYHDAQLKLVAGDVNRIQPGQPDTSVLQATPTRTPLPTQSPAQDVEQREFFEYQLYEVGRPVTIADNETKQVEFVSETGVPATIYYVFPGARFYGYNASRANENPTHYGGANINAANAQTWVSFETDEEQGLGADLPAGRVRVYQDDTDGAALFIRETHIDHTPEGEEVELFLGNAAKIVGLRTQEEFVWLNTQHIRETYSIKLRNYKVEEAVEVRVPEALFRWSNWEIVNTTHDYEQLDAGTIEFRVQIPPRDEVTIVYSVEYSW